MELYFTREVLLVSLSHFSFCFDHFNMVQKETIFTNSTSELHFGKTLFPFVFSKIQKLLNVNTRSTLYTSASIYEQNGT